MDQTRLEAAEADTGVTEIASASASEAYKCRESWRPWSKRRCSLKDRPIPPTSEVRLEQARNKQPPTSNTVFYLAYGSNLSNETFLGKRHIHPISQVNVLVPSLRLTFDLPGLPYTEPCFGNTARRHPDTPSEHVFEHDEKTPLLPPPQPAGYGKNRWHKGLVGSVYELTPTDFAHIIATEGGGVSYQDIVVDCYALPLGTDVPEHPRSAPFKAHTLFCPTGKEGGRGRVSRPNPGYAQPSARYLKLITNGAEERQLPQEYRDYLKQIRPYTMTTNKQRFGQMLISATFVPFLMFIFALFGMMSDEQGRAPQWLAELSGMLFKSVWIAYDGWFVKVCGDGERTITDGGRDGDAGSDATLGEQRRDAGHSELEKAGLGAV